MKRYEAAKTFQSQIIRKQHATKVFAAIVLVLINY